jgi:hypothetical protein
MNRALAAARLQFVHPAVILGMPWAIALSSFVINWAIWYLAELPTRAHEAFTGGVLALYVTVALVFEQAVTQLLPFAMGLSVSRRSYWLGTALVGVGSALGYGIVLAVLGAIERTTNGWGAGLEFWTPGPVRADGFLLQVLVSGMPMLAFIFAGIGVGVVVKRWGPNGVWALSILALLVVGGLSVLLTWRHAWDEIGRWLTEQTLPTLAIALPVALAAVMAAASYRGIRRVVP